MSMKLICAIGKNKYKFKFVFEVGKGTGNRKRETMIFEGGIREAENEHARLKALKSSPRYIASDKMTVKEYFTYWLDTYVSKEKAPSTYEAYKHAINKRIVPKIGGLQLDKLRPADIKKLYADIKKEGRLDGKTGDISDSTIKFFHRIVCRALRMAVGDELIPTNPTDSMDAPSMPKQNMITKTDKIKALSAEQLNFIISRMEGQYFRDLIFFASRTGLRKGELLGLSWSEVDTKNMQIEVIKSLSKTKDKGLFFKVPKTEKSRRKIDISKQAVEVLKAVSKKQAEYKLLYGDKYDKENNLVFCKPNGKPWNPHTVSDWFRKFMIEEKMPGFKFHSLRHTFASLMLQTGIDIKIVSEMLGHSSVKITYDVYGHLLPGMQRNAIEAYEEALNKPAK